MSTPSEYNVKAVLAEYMPSFLRLLGTREISWQSIDKNLQTYIEKAKLEFNETKSTLKREATFYSIIMSKAKGDGLGEAQFDFYDQLFTGLHAVLSPEEQDMLSGILRSVLTQLEKDYLNFIGELSVLYFYKINAGFQLLKVEEKIFDSKNISADFKFLNPASGNQFLVEVVNIHLEQRDKLTLELLEKVIGRKLGDKLKSKDVIAKRNMSLQPLIWCKNFEQLKQVSNYYNAYSIPEQTHKALGYLSFRTPDGELYHRISFLNEILYDYDSFKFDK